MFLISMFHLHHNLQQIWPDASLFVRNTHLHPTLLRSFGRGTNSHVPLAMSEPYSCCMGASHLLASSERITSHKFNGSSRQATLARSTSCWGRMWFFHHSPSGRHALKGYLRSSEGYPSCSPLVLASLDGVEGVDEHPGVGVTS
jgi:hypothetical protein